MYDKILCGAAILGGVGLLGYMAYNTYYNDNDADDTAGDTYTAGLNFGISGWKPELPTHPRAKAPTEGVYTPFKVVGVQRGKMGQMMPARSTDYWNPSQLVPSTGPGNLMPRIGISTYPKAQLPLAGIHVNLPNIDPESQSVVTRG